MRIITEKDIKNVYSGGFVKPDKEMENDPQYSDGTYAWYKSGYVTMPAGEYDVIENYGDGSLRLSPHPSKYERGVTFDVSTDTLCNH